MRLEVKKWPSMIPVGDSARAVVGLVSADGKPVQGEYWLSWRVKQINVIGLRRTVTKEMTTILAFGPGTDTVFIEARVYQYPEFKKISELYGTVTVVPGVN